MAKVTKNVLKGIVKECLVEILSEGLNVDVPIERSSSNLSGVTRRKSGNPNRRPALDNVTFGKKVDEATSVMTNDPLMSAIFADTARTTLQEQYGAESSNPRGTAMAMAGSAAQGDEAARAVSSNNTEYLLEGAGNWATLAFSEKGPGR